MKYGPLLKGALAGVFAGRFYADVPPDAPGRADMAVYQRVGGVPVYFTEGRLPDQQNARVQITVWSEKRSSASDLADACRKIAAEHPDMLPLDVPVDLYEETIKLYGSRFDLAVWHTI